MTPTLNKHSVCTALGILFSSLLWPRLTIGELQSVLAHNDSSRQALGFGVLLSIVIRGFVSLGTFWMWPAMNLFLSCGHLAARCGSTRDGDFADACRTDSGLLAFLQEEVGSREHGKGHL